jgi:hypothetical protein
VVWRGDSGKEIKFEEWFKKIPLPNYIQQKPLMIYGWMPIY